MIVFQITKDEMKEPDEVQEEGAVGDPAPAILVQGNNTDVGGGKF